MTMRYIQVQQLVLLKGLQVPFAVTDYTDISVDDVHTENPMEVIGIFDE